MKDLRATRRKWNDSFGLMINEDPFAFVYRVRCTYNDVKYILLDTLQFILAENSIFCCKNANSHYINILNIINISFHMSRLINKHKSYQYK